EEDPNCFVMLLDTLEGYCLTSLPDGRMKFLSRMFHKKFVRPTFSYNEVLNDDSEGHEYKIKVFHRPALSFDDHKKDYECDKIFGLSFLTLIMQFCSSPTFGCFWSNCAPSLLMITRKTTDVIEPLDCFS
ncbi:8643_t:CDS:2, partial [Rhizophagus irregularis]